jgi:hypothetical protein
VTAVADNTILTHTGRYVNPLDLRPDDVRIEDVAHALSNQCRYAGHTRTFYSVAEHSLWCAGYLEERGYGPDVALAGLLHDAAEAYLVDLPRPLKMAPGFGDLYREAEARAQRVLEEVFGLAHGQLEHPAVKRADLVLLATERRDLMPPHGDWPILDGVEPMEGVLTPMRPEVARRWFLHHYTRLSSKAWAA